MKSAEKNSEGGAVLRLVVEISFLTQKKENENLRASLQKAKELIKKYEDSLKEQNAIEKRKVDNKKEQAKRDFHSTPIILQEQNN